MDSSRRSNCSKFLHWCAFAGFDPVELTVARAEMWLESFGPLSPWKSTRQVAALAVFRMLTPIHPDRDFAWLKELASRQGKPRGEAATFAHRKCEGSLPLEEWPYDWQRRWSDATGASAKSGKKSAAQRYAGLRKRGTRNWSKPYADRIQNDLGAWLWIMREAGVPIDVNPKSLQIFLDAKREGYRDDRAGVQEKWLPAYVKRLNAGFGVVLPNGSPEFVGKTAKEMKQERTAAGMYEDDSYRAEHPAVLAAIGLLLIERARKLEFGSVARAELFRDGVLFFTCAYRAMRVGTVVRMKVGDHLNLAKERGRICAPASIMKARRAWMIDLNADIVAILREWIEVERPFMKNADSPWVFVSSQPSAEGRLAVQSVGKIVARHSLEYLGRELGTHDFRYATGTAAVEELPDNPWVGTAMLQQHDRRTLLVYAPGADMLAAADRFEQLAMGAKRKAERVVADTNRAACERPLG